jgi:hypothetical protein
MLERRKGEGTLKVLSTDEAGIDVQIGHGDRAQLLKVEIKHRPEKSITIIIIHKASFK